MNEEPTMFNRSICTLVCLSVGVGSIALADDKKKDEKEEKQSGPVKWSATIEPKSAKPGGEVTLKVKGVIEEGWHIYAVNKPTGLSRKTSLKLTLADKLKADKDWKIPDPVKDEKADEETFKYEGDVVFSRKIKVAESAEGALEASTTVEFMACNAETCLSPKKVTVKTALKVEK
jgi:DsbC/DsbD-like thiol-disulfide interchange protein